MNTIIATADAPSAIGPYSQAVLAGNTLYISGQIGMDPKTMELVGSDITAQTEQSMKNLAAVIKEAGFSLDDVVKCTCYLKSLQNFVPFNEVYGTYFTSTKPARECVEASLPKDALVEVSAICVKGS